MLERQRSFRRASVLNPDQKVAALPYSLCTNVLAINWFIAQGGDPNNYVHGLSSTRQTPLHVAAENNAADAVIALVKGGADANARSITDSTPLHDASKKRAWNAVEALIQHGARVDVVNSFDQTPLDIARAMQAEERILNLLRAPPTPSASALKQQRSARAAQLVREGSLRRRQTSSADDTLLTAPVSARPEQAVYLSIEQTGDRLLKEAGIQEMTFHKLSEARVDSVVLSFLDEDGMREAGISSALDRARILAWASRNGYRGR